MLAIVISLENNKTGQRTALDDYVPRQEYRPAPTCRFGPADQGQSARHADIQPRRSRTAATVAITDLAGATALVTHLQSCAQRLGINLETTLRAAPPVPTACCGRGCDGCLWTSYFTALQHWRDDACALLSRFDSHSTSDPAAIATKLGRQESSHRLDSLPP